MTSGQVRGLVLARIFCTGKTLEGVCDFIKCFNGDVQDAVFDDLERDLQLMWENKHVCSWVRHNLQFLKPIHFEIIDKVSGFEEN